MKRWRHRERLGDLIESPRGEYVLFNEAERYGGSEYARGYANGSGDEGYYQREIARLKDALERIQQERLTWAMTCHPHECTACDLLDQAIRASQPQSAPIDTVSGNVYSTVHGKDESGTAPGAARQAREDGPEAV